MDKIKDKLKLVPNLPGSYQMKDKSGTIIYVGKAKNLHKRVSSYFNREHTGKTSKLVSEIDDFEYIVTSSEVEAFVLEINLIKLHDPKYNILLKDDKTYPYIEYISKPYPKLKIVRYTNLRKKDKKTIFGPYPNAYAARRIVNLLNRLYPLKKCDGMPKQVCLYYHINECLGYCVKKIDQGQLKNMEDDILSFLRGNDSILTNKLKSKIMEYSSNLNYEKALELKKELDYINIIMDKQKVELHDFVNRDIIAYYFDKGYISVQIFFLRNGKLIGHHNDIFPIISEEIDEVEYYIVNFYQKHEIPNEIIIPSNLNKDILEELLKTKVSFVQKGTKKKILDMAKTNAKIAFNNKFETLKQQEMKTSGANESLRKILNLDKLDRIDSFDNSNLFGSFSVSGMVVFKDGKPAKKEYRKYKVSVDKNDDYHTMQEVIYRRYYKALLNKTELPDLIIVDGGINQINACIDVLNSLKLDIRVCGLKKNDKHRTNELIDSLNYQVIPLDATSDVFHYLTRIQDEVHRYTITYHKTIRSKGSISSILDNVEGIGTVRKKELIKKFGSVVKMKNASLEELEEILPSNIAIDLQKYLKEYSNK
ncbi:MAG TPA: excinuclease ABC subunit UvrC [Bacilli bacterium]|nr:excinuclease ABC subunit UvrC [Bacilli bacterium]